VTRREWSCPRCQQSNDAGDRWCFFCKLDTNKHTPHEWLDPPDVEALYLDVLVG